MPGIQEILAVSTFSSHEVRKRIAILNKSDFFLKILNIKVKGETESNLSFLKGLIIRFGVFLSGDQKMGHTTVNVPDLF